MDVGGSSPSSSIPLRRRMRHIALFCGFFNALIAIGTRLHPVAAYIFAARCSRLFKVLIRHLKDFAGQVLVWIIILLTRPQLLERTFSERTAGGSGTQPTISISRHCV